VLCDLSSKLKAQLRVHVHGNILSQLDLFRSADSAELFDAKTGWDMAQELITFMHPMVFGGGDVILREGDPATEMYFIMVGDVKVIAYDETMKQATVQVSRAGSEPASKAEPGFMGVGTAVNKLSDTVQIMSRESVRAMKGHSSRMTKALMKKVKRGSISEEQMREALAEQARKLGQDQMTGEEILQSGNFIGISKIDSGAHFGEIPLLPAAELPGVDKLYTNGRCVATHIALNECSCQCMDAGHFREMVKKHPPLLKLFVKQARETIDMMEDAREHGGFASPTRAKSTRELTLAPPASPTTLPALAL